jgi:antirestriction protein ArdC
MTYKQATERGGFVRKGEKSTPIVFWKVTEGTKARQDGEGTENDRRFTLRYYNVFNLEQTTLAPAEAAAAEPLPSCSGVLDGWQNKPRLVLDSPTIDRAAYIPAEDTVIMPLLSRFDSQEHFFATIYHELIHSTGHASRLNREAITTGARFGSESYSREELIAEIGSAFLCGHTGINKPEIEENTTAYLQNWIAVLKGDSRLVVSAAAHAQHAADMILGTAEKEQTEDVGELTTTESQAA